MADVLTSEERRDFSRIALHRPAVLDAAGSRVACELLDISLRGALVSLAEGFEGEVGARCTLLVRLDEATSLLREGSPVIRMNGEIAHRDLGTVGVRCLDLDLDSVAHLRRLLEVNLAEDSMVQREMVALVSSRRR